MNFFAQQEKTHRKSHILFFYLAIAIIFIAFTFAMFFALCYWLVAVINDYNSNFIAILTHPVYIGSFLLGATLLILIPTIRSYRELATGGFVIAYMMGGKPVNPQYGDFKIRQFINVTEEISIASGCIMPSLYVMESRQDINAFVAGCNANDAVLVVTQGALDKLDREELQGVIGHEFSHILNGDIKINLIMTSIIYGLTYLVILGKSFVAKDNDNRDYLLAAGLYIIGSVGRFAANMITAAVSRQREFLADASSAQFTRDPEALVNALRKTMKETFIPINNDETSYAYSQFFFTSNFEAQRMKWLALHPPITERITALLGGARYVDYPENTAVAEPIKKKNLDHTQPLTESYVSTIGNLNLQHLVVANGIQQDILSAFGDVIHDPYGAKIIVYALLSMENFNEDILRKELDESEANQVIEDINQIVPIIQKLGMKSRLPLLEILIPALRFLTNEDLTAFLKNIEKIIDADDKISLFEFVASTIINNQLLPKTNLTNEIKYTTFNDVISSVSCLFILMAKLMEEDSEKAYYSCMKNLYNDKDIPAYSEEGFSVKEIHSALSKLELLSPELKEFLLNVCESQLLNDENSITHIEVLRAIADLLDCPIPVTTKQ